MGTVLYMAPEQIRGAGTDGRTDIYALGVVLFEVLAGRPPFQGENVLAQHLQAPPPSLTEFCPDAPMDLERLVQSCLAKEMDQRPQDCGQVHSVLQTLSTQLSALHTL